ncbi:MAG: acyl-CoA dehydrogenase family protein [Deltaproteobacteria bacterium]|nr:acyl-CoA dehydrogenase family protein [Deltaproteobacteria bacterium]
MKYPQFTEAHDMFRKTVRQFTEKELLPHVEKWEHDKIFPAKEIFKKAGDLGILGAHYPEDVGGGGGDYWFSVCKAEEYPRCRMGGPPMALLVQSDMATPVINDLGTKEQKEEFLTPAIKGEKIASLGVSEPGAGSDVAGISTVAKKDGDDYLISGSKTYITNGAQADFVTLLTKTDPGAGAHGCTFFLVPTKLKGFEVSKKLIKAGNHSSDTAMLFFDNVRVPKRYRLGEEGMGFMYLMQNFQTERLIACVGSTAGMQLAIEDSIGYGKDRMAFGKPIIKREYWQHKFVDLLCKVEACRALTYQAVAEYNREKYVEKTELSMDTVKLISMCKVFVGDTSNEVFDQCVQFHGGAGYLEEYPISRAWRDARLLRIGGGTTETMRYYIAKLLGL